MLIKFFNLSFCIVKSITPNLSKHSFKAPYCVFTSVRSRVEGYIAHYVTHQDYAPCLLVPWINRVTMPVCMGGWPSLIVTYINGLNCVEAVGFEAFIAKKFYCFISIIYLEKIILDINIVLFPKKTLQKKKYKRPWNDSVFLFCLFSNLEKKLLRLWFQIA